MASVPDYCIIIQCQLDQKPLKTLTPTLNTLEPIIEVTETMLKSWGPGKMSRRYRLLFATG